MIQVYITSMGKSYNPKDSYCMFDEQLKNFHDMDEAKAWLSDTYGKSKRSKMFVDQADKSVHCGYIIGFRNADISHVPVQKWLQQDWIEFREVKTLALV